MTKSNFYILLLLLLTPLYAYSQSNRTPEQIIGDLLETISNDNELRTTNNQAFENLLDIINNPIPINSATKETLENLIFLSPIQVQNLFDFTQNMGDISSIYQLQGVEGLSEETLKTLQYFIFFDESNQSNPSKNYLNGQWIIRDVFDVENAKAYTNDSIGTKYLGNKHHIYSRLQLKYGKNWQAGLTIDKDPGELLWQSSPEYVDFYSAYLMYSSKKVVKNLIIGDYNVNIGQGLALWTGTNMGKSTEALDIIKRGSSISKYTSANESGYFRGIASTFSLKRSELTLFVNYKDIDANIETNENNENVIISMPETGYHRTESELERKHALTQKSIGGNYTYFYNNLSLAIGGYYNAFDADSIAITDTYKQLSSPNIEQTNYWANYKYSHKSLIFFGEIATTSGFQLATTNGLLFSPKNNISLSLLYRNIQSKYYSLYTNAFTEYGSPSGEQGIYFGMVSYPISRLEVSGYIDLFKTDWIKYQTYAPANGYDLMLNVNYKFTDNFNIYIRYKEKEKVKNTNLENHPLYDITMYNQKKFRLHGTYKSSLKSQVQFRFEKSLYRIKGAESQGYLSYIDFKQTFNKNKITAWIRYSVFKTDDYNTRIYTYENDLLYNFYTPAFQNEGSRIYAQCRWKIIDPLRFWIKYSRTWYSHKTEIGSGANAISGNTRTNLKMQLQYIF